MADAKLYLFLLAPFNWILMTVILAVILRRKRISQVLFIVSIVLLIVFGNRIIYNRVMLKWQPRPVALNSGAYEAGVVLGGMTWVEEGEKGYFRSGADRFIQTLTLYNTHVIKKIIISAGGKATDQPLEARFLVSRFIKAGVPAADLVVEANSSTTYENAVFTKRIVDSMQITTPVVLITSAIHLPRAEKVFAKAGVKVASYPCDYDVVNVKESVADYFWPDADVLDKWKYLLKEWVGIGYYKAKGYI